MSLEVQAIDTHTYDVTTDRCEVCDACGLDLAFEVCPAYTPSEDTLYVTPEDIIRRVIVDASGGRAGGLGELDPSDHRANRGGVDRRSRREATRACVCGSPECEPLPEDSLDGA